MSTQGPDTEQSKPEGSTHETSHANAEQEIAHSALLTDNIVRKMLELNRQYDAFSTSLLGRSTQVYDTPTVSCEEAIAQLRGNSASVIVMDGVYVSPEDGARMAQALASNTSVKRLRMTECGINDAVAKSIAEALKVNTTLEDLQLSTNAIHDEGLIALGEALRESASIKFFAVRYNDFDDAGAAAFFEKLRGGENSHSDSKSPASDSPKVSSLEILSLCNNEVGDETALQLAKFLNEHAQGRLKSKYPKLHQINFFNNQVTDRGVQALLEPLSLPSMDIQLIFPHSRASAQASALVAQALRHHPSLHQIAPFQIVRLTRR